MQNQIQEIFPHSITQTNIAKSNTYYFLFINTKSGNKQGLKYCDFTSKKLKYIFESGNNTFIQFFDMFDAKRAKLGFQYAKKLTQQEINNNNVRFIVCGGDGTIPWVLSSAKNANIDFQKIYIGILPIGTGNDLSRSIGWGYKTVEFSSRDFSSLHKLVKKWNDSKLGFYDIWDIQIQILEGGGFYEIKNQIQVKNEEKKVLKKSFTNYFGIGLDGRIVYNVEKNRGSNAFLNKALYALVGAKKLFEHLDSIIDTIEYVRQTSQQSEPSQELISSSEQPMTSKQIRQEGDEYQYKMNQQSRVYQQFQLKKNYKGLVCLNCTSYMCGLRNVWMTPRSTSEKLDIKLNKSPQKYDDGKVQFMTFNNQLTLALQRVIRTGTRIGQGSGPFQIKFKQKKVPTTTYMQIDGESMKIQKIKCIRIKKSEIYPNSRINVLINEQD